MKYFGDTTKHVKLRFDVLQILCTSGKYPGLQISVCSYVLRYYKYSGLQENIRDFRKHV